MTGAWCGGSRRLRRQGLLLSILALAGGLLLAEPAAASTAPQLFLYGADSSLQKVAVYRAISPGSPTVVLIHGGGWAVGDSSWVAPEARELQAAGNAVVNVDYRLSSSSRPAFPDEIDDVLAATRWAVDNAAAYNGVSGRVDIVGGSAGGQLAAEVALTLNTDSPGTVQKVVILSGVSNLVSLVSDADAGRLDPHLASNVYQALGCRPGTCSAAAERAWSPAWHAAAPCATWSLYESAADVMPRAQFSFLAAQLRRAGCTVTTTLVPGASHSFGYWPREGPAIKAFLG